MAAKVKKINSLSEAFQIMTRNFEPLKALFEIILEPSHGLLKPQLLPKAILKNDLDERIKSYLSLHIKQNVLTNIFIENKEFLKKQGTSSIQATTPLELEKREVIQPLDELFKKWRESNFDVKKAFPERKEWAGNKIILIGDPGYGKTNSAFIFYIDMMRKYLDEQGKGVLPFIITAKSMEENIKKGVIGALIDQITKVLGLLSQDSRIQMLKDFLEAVHKNHPYGSQVSATDDGFPVYESINTSPYTRLFLIVDGLDEVDLACREDMNNILMRWPGPILFTSRMINLDKWHFDNQQYPQWKIMPINPEHVDILLEKWQKSGENVAELRNYLKNHPSFKETLRVPLLATIACKLADKLKFNNLTRTDLLLKMVDHLLEDASGKSENVNQLQHIKKNAAQDIENMMAHMPENIKVSMRETFNNVIDRLGKKKLSRDKVQNMLGLVITKTFDGQRWVISKENFTQFGKGNRGDFDVETLDAFDLLVGDAKILRKIHKNAEDYEILHQAIAEVLVAKTLKASIQNNSKNDLVLMLKKCKLRFYDPRFHEVWCHFANLLETDHLEIFIKALVPDLFEKRGSFLNDFHPDDIFDSKLILASRIASERKKLIPYVYKTIFKKMLFGDKNHDWHYAAKIALHQADRFKNLNNMLSSKRYKLALVEIKTLGSRAFPVAQKLVLECFKYFKRFDDPVPRYDPNLKNEFRAWITALESVGYPVFKYLKMQKYIPNNLGRFYFRVITFIVVNHQNSITKNDEIFLLSVYKKCLSFTSDETEWLKVATAFCKFKEIKNDLIKWVKNDLKKIDDRDFVIKLRFLSETIFNKKKNLKFILCKVDMLLKTNDLFNATLTLILLEIQNDQLMSQIIRLWEDEFLSVSDNQFQSEAVEKCSIICHLGPWAKKTTNDLKNILDKLKTWEKKNHLKNELISIVLIALVSVEDTDFVLNFLLEKENQEFRKFYLCKIIDFYFKLIHVLDVPSTSKENFLSHEIFEQLFSTMLFKIQVSWNLFDWKSFFQCCTTSSFFKLQALKWIKKSLNKEIFLSFENSRNFVVFLNYYNFHVLSRNDDLLFNYHLLKYCLQNGFSENEILTVMEKRILPEKLDGELKHVPKKLVFKWANNSNHTIFEHETSITKISFPKDPLQ